MMEHLNPELIKQRMMKGGLRGSLHEEITTMARCKGKLEDGTRCKIIAAPGKDRCTKCEAIGAELYDKVMKAPEPVMPAVEKAGKKPGRPAKKGAISEAEQELQAATLTVTSSKTGKPLMTFSQGVGIDLCSSCTGDDYCSGRPGFGITECAAYSPKESASVNENPKLKHDKIDEAESAALAGGPLPRQCIFAGKGYCTHPGRISCVDCPETGSDCPGREIVRAAPIPPQEAIDHCAESGSHATEYSKGLSALLRAPIAPPPGMFVPFAPEELAALDESEVTPEIIRDFVIMGLEGKLTRLDDAAA